MQSEKVECRDFHNLNISAYPNGVCGFINATDDCQINEGFVNYAALIYCHFANVLPLGVVIVFVLLFIFFIGLGVTADDFFCPSLRVIAKTLRLSDNIAGVTFLAFGNGAPDVFSAISAIGSASNGDAGLAVGALLGAGIFVTTVVAGTIAIANPFVAMERPLLRDIIFYLAALFMMFFVLYHGSISLYMAIGFIGLYLVYVLVVVVGRYIRQRRKRRIQQQLNEANIPPTFSSIQSPDDIEGSEDDFPDLTGEQTRVRTRSDKAVKSLARAAENVGVSSVVGDERQNPTLRPITSVDETANPQPASYDDPLLENHEYGLRSPSDDEPLLANHKNDNPPAPEKLHPCTEFLMGMNPIDVDGWHRMSCFGKIYEIIKAPLLFLLKITIPVVDYDENKHGWNKLLNAMHCVTGLLFALFAIFAKSYAVMRVGADIPIWIIVFLFGVILAVTVLLTTKQNQPPKFHWMFAYIGFVVAVLWIYSIANEIVNILQALGIVFNITNAILGLTLLAWGNSIGDFVSNTIMARQGFPRTGISACFGGPLFNLLLGIGIPFTIQTIKLGADVKINFTLQQVVLVSFLAFSLLSSLIIVPLAKFRFSRGYGIYLIFVYIAFIIIAILVEVKVITATV